ncbi:MAG TPA: S9 family peptidase [Chitinophagaceae bacterium]|nr:S9 family peptidase [Chitinophagaceae bacterium]
MSRFPLLSFIVLLSIQAFSQPSIRFENVVSLKQCNGAMISPSGKHVLFIINSTDWENNSYDAEIWLSKDGTEPYQLTNTAKGNSFAADFSPDEKWISFLADRGNKTQLYLISILGGEAFPITKEDEGINSYAWSPDGKQIAIVKTDPDSKTLKQSKEKYGAFGVEGEEYKLSHLWLLNFNIDSVRNAGLLPCNKADTTVKNSPCYELPKATKLSFGNFTIGRYEWSPDGKQIAFTKLPDPLINSNMYADVALINLADKKIKTIISNPSSDQFLNWSPGGDQIIFTSSVNDSVSNYFLNNRVFTHQLATGKNTEILSDIDENKNVVTWDKKGIYFTALKKTKAVLYLYDPVLSKTTEIQTGTDLPSQVSFSKDGSMMSLNARQYTSLNELFLGPTGGPLKQLTKMSAQIRGWNVPTNELIQWKSKDGAEIEGVLLKPSNYDPKIRYPLLVVIHGGPTGTDRPEPVPGGVYPIMQWCEKGALVLRVNYRGSAGYGEKFRSLNVRNLGVGDMWDVMSGIDYLSKKGMIDTTRMGCMGWSQGGYISAFLTTNTNRFKAISVGAGISNWVTYYVNTDITPFTRQYLKATPWSDMAVYEKTSPMTNINKASTPTLIQHGEFDKRVPIPNAYELYRGLRDRGIPSELIVYKGFGHGITKPKERLAALTHNWIWFNHYVFGDKMENLTLE